jgi:hypothetical protein
VGIGPGESQEFLPCLAFDLVLTTVARAAAQLEKHLVAARRVLIRRPDFQGLAQAVHSLAEAAAPAGIVSVTQQLGACLRVGMRTQ